MPKKSAGILLYRMTRNFPEVFLVHPGGPFWKNKNTGSWSIPKGELNENEDAFVAAKRELKEETGIDIDSPELNILSTQKLNEVKQKTGKIVYAWALEGDFNMAELKSNLFQIEWPPKSHKMVSFPEIDKGEWLDMNTARERILAYQVPFLAELENLMKD